MRSGRPSVRAGTLGAVNESATAAPSSIEGKKFSFKELDANARPTRDDDTVVISGGRRATREEILAHIAADAASRTDG